MIFNNVTAAGVTSVAASGTGPEPPAGFTSLTPSVYYSVSTTAAFRGPVRVCLSWLEGEVRYEWRVHLFDYALLHFAAQGVQEGDERALVFD